MQTEIITLVSELEDYHAKALPASARVYYVETLDRYPIRLVRDAISRWRQANSPSSRFPSLLQLKTLIDDARTHLWRRGKALENKNPISDPTVNSDPAYQQAGWKLVQRARNMSLAELIDAFSEMDRNFPGRGWDQAALRLRS